MNSNNARVARALYLLKLDLDNFVAREFTNHHQDQTLAVLNQILGQSRDSQKPFHNMKTQDLLTVVQSSWWNVFDRAMGGIEPNLVRELALTHEAWAGRNNFSAESAFQALNSVQRLLAAMSSPSTLELDMLKRECLESDIEAEIPAADEVPVPGDEAASSSDSTAADDGPVNVEPIAAEAEGETIVTGEVEASPTDDEPYLVDLIRALLNVGALRDEDVLVRAIKDRVQARYADESVFQELHPSLVHSLADQGIRRIYGYQAEALTQIMAGNNVVLEAGWGADETVTLAVTLSESLLRSPGCHGLALCPDEESVGFLADRLKSLLATTGIRIIAGHEDFSGSLAETGETAPSTVLVASVDALNSALAGLRQEWQYLLKDVKFIGLHRAQEYHGYFGTNVAVLLRRLAHRLAILGANPLFFLVAQGCANGVELARNLTGKTFQGVSGLERPAPRRYCVAVGPRDVETPGQVDLPDRVARAALACLESGKSVLVYCAEENLARISFAAACELDEDLVSDAAAFSLTRPGPSEQTAGANGDGTEGEPSRAVFTAEARGPASWPANFDGVIVAGALPMPRLALQLMESAGSDEDSDSFALFFSPTDFEGRLTVRNFGALIAKEPDQVVADPDISAAMRAHLPALVYETEGRVYSFSGEALGSSVFQAVRREGASLAGSGAIPEAPDLRPTSRGSWNLLCEDRRVSSLSPYGKFREIYQGSVIPLDGKKYRVAAIDPGDGEGATPVVVLESSEALANLRTVPSFSTDVTVEDESLCLTPTPGVSLHLGRVAVEETLGTVSVIDESGSPDPDAGSAEGEEYQDLVTASFAPEEEASWSMVCQSFWIDVAGLLEEGAPGAEGDDEDAVAPAVVALEQMYRLGARFTFPVGKYDLAAYSQGTAVFLAEVSPAAQGIVKKAFDHWRDILQLGVALARRCPWCLLPASPYERPIDKDRGLALAERLLEITRGA